MRTAERAVELIAGLLDRLPTVRPTLTVLTYHRIEPSGSRPDLHPGIRVDPEAFAAHVALVAERATPVSADDLLRARRGGASLPPRSVHVTLDDAYRSVESHAWPVLRDAGVPATLFVPTAYPGTRTAFWWDRLHRAVLAADRILEVDGRRWPVTTAEERRATFRGLRDHVSAAPHPAGWDIVSAAEAAAGGDPAEPATSDWAGLRAMAAEGLALAPHSRTHPLLHRCRTSQIEEEVGGSWDDLRAEVGEAARPLFAHPGGGWDDRVATVVRSAGLEVAMTTERGVNDGRAPDWGALLRVNVGPSASPALVRVQMHPSPHRARAGALVARDRLRSLLVRDRGRPTTPASGGRSWT